MPKLNVQQNNAGVIQALKNALAIGQINGTVACDGENNFSAGTPGGGGVDLGITGATVGQVPVVASVNGSGAPTSWTPATPGGGGDTSLGITGASAGEYAKIKTVDANGAPTSWGSGSGGGGGGGINFEVGAEKWYGTYTDENGVTYQVYTKTIYIPALAGAAGATIYPHEITNIKQILSAYGFTTDGFVLNAPRQNVADNISIYQVRKIGGIVIEVGKDCSSKSAYVTLIYAKTN